MLRRVNHGPRCRWPSQMHAGEPGARWQFAISVADAGASAVECQAAHVACARDADGQVGREARAGDPSVQPRRKSQCSTSWRESLWHGERGDALAQPTQHTVGPQQAHSRPTAGPLACCRHEEDPGIGRASLWPMASATPAWPPFARHSPLPATSNGSRALPGRFKPPQTRCAPALPGAGLPCAKPAIRRRRCGPPEPDAHGASGGCRAF